MTVAMERKLILELIEEYKSCTCLWKIKDPDYKNKEVKNETYESLLQLIKKYNDSYTLDDLKRKIANLRTCYLREFKKVMDAKKYGGIYEPSLWYYKSLEFLNDQHHGEDRARLSRSYPDNSDEDNELNETRILAYEDQAGSEDKEPCFFETDQPPPIVVSSLQTTMDAVDANGGGDVHRPKRRRRRLLDVSSSTHLDWYTPSISAAADSFEPQILGGVGGDPVDPPVADYYDGFGRYVANELRQTDRQSVIIAKRLINEVLFLGQMGMLNVNTRIETPPPTVGRRKNAVLQQQSYDERELMTPVEFMETS